MHISAHSAMVHKNCVCYSYKLQNNMRFFPSILLSTKTGAKRFQQLDSCLLWSPQQIPGTINRLTQCVL